MSAGAPTRASDRPAGASASYGPGGPASRRLVAVAAGLRLARATLATAPTAVVVLLALAAALLVAIVERGVRVTGAPDRALGALFRFVLPLACFSLLSAVTRTRRLQDSLWSVARWGLRRGWAAAGMLLGVGAAAALLSLASVALCLGLAHASVESFAADLVTSGWVGVLAAVCYVALFAASATFVGRGHGRWLALAGDFFLGSGTGALAIGWPRSHLTNLAGGPAPLELAQHWSSAALGALAVGLALLACARCRG